MTKNELNLLYGMRKNVLSSMYGIQSNRGVRCTVWSRLWPATGILMPGRYIYVDTDSVKYIEEIDCKQG